MDNIQDIDDLITNEEDYSNEAIMVEYVDINELQENTLVVEENNETKTYTYETKIERFLSSLFFIPIAVTVFPVYFAPQIRSCPGSSHIPQSKVSVLSSYSPAVLTHYSQRSRMYSSPRCSV